MTEHEQARQWRSAMRLSIAELSELTGYSKAAISLFERGTSSNGGAHPLAARHRYKLACLAVCFLRHYQMELENWPWQALDNDFGSC